MASVVLLGVSALGAWQVGGLIAWSFFGGITLFLISGVAAWGIDSWAKLWFLHDYGYIPALGFLAGFSLFLLSLTRLRLSGWGLIVTFVVWATADSVITRVARKKKSENIPIN